MSERDRPSRHGAILGEALVALAEAGRATTPDLPEMCATCAFREGCMTNLMAATGLIAFNCATGVDSDDFACHHGMKDGWPTKMCAGYAAARLAPFPVLKRIVMELDERLAVMTGADGVRADFDAWLITVDPDGRMDDYQRGRAFSRRPSVLADQAGSGS